MSIRLSVIAMLGLISVGCAPTVMRWTRPGSTQQEFAVDKYQCVRESRTSWNAFGPPLVVLAAQIDAENQAAQLFRLCMEAHGWTGTLVNPTAPIEYDAAARKEWDDLAKQGIAKAPQDRKVRELNPTAAIEYDAAARKEWDDLAKQGIAKAPIPPLPWSTPEEPEGGCPGKSRWNGLGCVTETPGTVLWVRSEWTAPAGTEIGGSPVGNRNQGWQRMKGYSTEEACNGAGREWIRNLQPFMLPHLAQLGTPRGGTYPQSDGYYAVAQRGDERIKVDVRAYCLGVDVFPAQPGGGGRTGG